MTSLFILGRLVQRAVGAVAAVVQGVQAGGTALLPVWAEGVMYEARKAGRC